jgi:SAM-dependent methyltransferase
MSMGSPTDDAHHCTYYVQGKTFEEHLAWLAQAFPHVRECVDSRGMPPAVLSAFFRGLDERSRDFDGVHRNGRGDSYRKAQADPLVRSVGIRRLFELVYPRGADGRFTPACLLLDLLGGDGTLARAFGRLFSPQSPTIVTSDISGDMIVSAVRGGLPALRQPAHHLLLRNACFHGVICAYGTHHIPRAELPLVAAEALRVLHPGGRVVLHDFEADSSVDRWFRDVVHPFSPTGHNFPHFERCELSRYLRDAGFRAVHETYLYDPFLFYGPTPEEVRQKALDYLLDMYGLSKLVDGNDMGRAYDLLWEMMQRYFCYDLESLDVPPDFGASRPSLRQEQGLWRLELPRVALVATGTK